MSSVKQPVGWSVSQLSVSQLASHVSRSVSQTNSLSLGRSASPHSVSKSVSHVRWLVEQINSQSVSQSVSQLAGRRSVDQPATEPISQSVSQSRKSVRQTGCTLSVNEQAPANQLTKRNGL